MKAFKLFGFLITIGAFALINPNVNAAAQNPEIVEINCSSLGSMSLQEDTPNDDLPYIFSNYLVLTLPNGNKVNSVRAHGANVRNLPSPSSGVTFSDTYLV